MTLFVGIDGGGSGCRAAVADGTGRILAEAQAGPANIASDVAGACDNILSATRAALTMAVGSAGVLSDLTAGLGLAGANAAGAAAALRQALPFARLRIETDAFAAAKGALRGEDGIVAAIGTGTVFASQLGGRLRELGGWGLVLGDEGSGAWLGRSLLRLSLRAAEGFIPDSDVLRRIRDDLGGPAGVIAFSLAARPADLAALAPHVVATDDPFFQTLLAEATGHVADSIARLQADPPLPVTFIGGLGATYAGRLADRWTLAPARGSALDGALALAREAA